MQMFPYMSQDSLDGLMSMKLNEGMSPSKETLILFYRLVVEQHLTKILYVVFYFCLSPTKTRFSGLIIEVPI